MALHPDNSLFFPLFAALKTSAKNVTIQPSKLGGGLLWVPLQLYCGAWEKPAGHLQGIAMDDEGRYMYYSFTDRLIKADMRTGEIVGSVTGLLAGGIYGGGAHMGCLAYHDGRVYGSLEYKAAEKFYVAVFDCAAITRMDMDYKTPGVMTAMYMDEVVRDYVCDLSAGEHNNAPDSMGHRFGCSGIDGITFGPVPGEADKGVHMLLAPTVNLHPQVDLQLAFTSPT